jgi:hypothetical protein
MHMYASSLSWVSPVAEIYLYVYAPRVHLSVGLVHVDASGIVSYVGTTKV